jgi:hypothetical protein
MTQQHTARRTTKDLASGGKKTGDARMHDELCEGERRYRRKDGSLVDAELAASVIS